MKRHGFQRNSSGESGTPSDEAAADYIATRIAPKFGVAAEVIAKRLRVEKLWPPE